MKKNKKKNTNYKKIIVTGGLGFIGVNLVEYLLKKKCKVLCIDKVTYASNINIFRYNKNFIFKKIDICKTAQVKKIILHFKPDCIFHLAAETHVDNSIKNSKIFIKSNILGMYSLLNILKYYYEKIDKKVKFINISTDEVYGSIRKGSFSENNKFYPNSPYSASKASSDMLARAWYKTFKLPIITTNCSNNFGPFQHKEKLIPKIINNLIQNKKIPIYGNGKNMRDWIYVYDHVRILYSLYLKGKIGETYNIGANCILSNIDILKKLIKVHNSFNKYKKTNFKDVINFVEDRKAHDFRYAINTRKINKLKLFKNKKKLDESLELTYKWYLKNN
jgi:dTDP-glucose 4,6-dehydratase